MEVNIHQAKTHFSRLLQRVAAGEEITIARAGKPVAKLIAVGPSGGKRPMGMDKGKIWIADDFNAPDPELEALFYDAPLTTNESGKSKKKRKKK
ncbi:MAG: type II toxin-antitoxin system Phd/YefM family antitoxin [Acidobacteriia bacterium]|nr:type II toxin-antitoxin system Phd/YefM family antitoxin [Terriglobia bacterium]